MAETIRQIPRTVTSPTSSDSFEGQDGTGGYQVTLANINAALTGLTVAQGGTGAATLTAHGPLLGEGTSSVAAASAGTAGQVFTSGGASADGAYQNVSFVQPQGRLSLVSATPVMNADATAQGTIYYCEYEGNNCPVYNGTVFRVLTFSNLSLILDSSNFLLNNVYDVFLWSNAGVATLGAGPAWLNTATVTWTSAAPGVCSWTAHGLKEGAPVVFTAGTSTPTGITAGTTYFVSSTSLTANSFVVSTTIANAAAGTNVTTSSTGVGTQTGTNHTTARGTGANTTQIGLTNGLWTNTNAITLNNNSVSSGSITANQATYLGSFFCTANGQTGMAFTPAVANGGTNNILGLFNAYNRVPLAAVSRDNTANWTYTSATWRAADNNVLNRISYLDGLQQLFAIGTATTTATTANNAGGPAIGVSFDSTTIAPLTGAAAYPTNSTYASLTSRSKSTPLLGFHYAQAVEACAGTSETITFFGATNSVQNQQLMLELQM